MAFSEKLAQINSSKKIRHQILPSSGFARETLRNKGQFWTPEWVAEAMTSYVLLDKSSILFDPSVGEGVFYQTAKKLNTELGYTPKLFGYEVDSEVLKQAIKNDLSSQDLANVQISDFVLNPPKQKFSAIVSNPPYIRHHRLGQEKKLFLKKFSQNLVGFSVDGRAGFHVYFFLRALESLAANGRLAFIMPADVCEGIFAEKLWKWITRNFCLEAVVTFTPEATPFPDVDTNPLIFFIKKSRPQTDFLWVKCKKPWTKDLKNFVISSLNKSRNHLKFIKEKSLKESKPGFHVRLKISPTALNFHSLPALCAALLRARTNSFFHQRTSERKNIPAEFLKIAIGRTRDIESEEITFEDIDALDKKGKPTLLFSPDGRKLEDFSCDVRNYLLKGERLGLPEKALISQRKPWYRMEKRVPPTFLFAYLGRRNIRFVKNSIGVLPLTGFLCVYSHSQDDKFNETLWLGLNHPDTLFNLQFVGKSYGSGAIKVEPRSLEKLIIPNHIIKKFNLPKLSLF